MNKTKIEWVDYTHNLITGCLNNCSYCYAEKLTKRFPNNYPTGFKPTLHTDRFNIKPKPNTTVFLNSMGETFGEWLNKSWVNQVLKYVQHNRKNQFVILTKNPENLKHYNLEISNLWLGVSIDKIDYLDFYTNLLKRSNATHKIVSFEPLLTDMENLFPTLYGIDWVIVGGKTGNKPFIPPTNWVNNIIYACRYYEIPIFLKDNLEHNKIIREYPRGYKND